jgi:hypothetical protein
MDGRASPENFLDIVAIAEKNLPKDPAERKRMSSQIESAIVLALRGTTPLYNYKFIDVVTRYIPAHEDIYSELFDWFDRQQMKLDACRQKWCQQLSAHYRQWQQLYDDSHIFSYFVVAQNECAYIDILRARLAGVHDTVPPHHLTGAHHPETIITCATKALELVEYYLVSHCQLAKVNVDEALKPVVIEWQESPLSLFRELTGESFTYLLVSLFFVCALRKLLENRLVVVQDDKKWLCKPQDITLPYDTIASGTFVYSDVPDYTRWGEGVRTIRSGDIRWPDAKIQAALGVNQIQPVFKRFLLPYQTVVGKQPLTEAREYDGGASYPGSKITLVPVKDLAEFLPLMFPFQIRKTAANEHTNDDKKERWLQIKQQIDDQYPEYGNLLKLPTQPPAPISPPLDASQFFTGRETIINEVVAQILQTQATIGITINIYSLYGLPGIGKSELAKQILLKLQQMQVFPDGYVWLSLETEPEKNVWSMLAASLGLPNLAKIPRDQDQLTILQKILSVIRPLVILDNADNIKSVDAAMQVLHGQTVIITSRKDYVEVPAVIAHEVNDLTEPEAVELYYKISYRAHNVDFVKLKQEYEAIEKIIKRLSYHPQCIEIVASIACIRHLSYAAVLEALKKQGIAMIELPKGVRYKKERYQAIKKTFQMAMDEDFSGFTAPKRHIHTLFVAASIVCGDYFYLPELVEALKLYVGLFERENQKIEELRAEREPKQNPIMQWLGLTESTNTQKPEGSTEHREQESQSRPDDKGILEILSLLSDVNSLTEIFDNLVACRLIKPITVPHDAQTRYGFHPLLREYAWDIYADYLTENIWQAAITCALQKSDNLTAEPDQIKNLRFFLYICQIRKLPDYFGTILRPMSHYLRDQGSWGEEYEALHTGLDWFQISPDYSTQYPAIYGWMLQRMGDLLLRQQEQQSGRSYLVKAKEVFSRIGQIDQALWIDYWLTDKEQNPQAMLGNLRKASQVSHVACYIAMLRAIAHCLDFVCHANFYWQTQRCLLQHSAASPDNFQRLLFDLQARQMRYGNFAFAEKLLAWAKKFQQIEYDAENVATILNLYFELYLAMDNLDKAQAMRDKYIDSQKALRCQVTETQFSTLGRICFAAKHYADAAQQFLQLTEQNQQKPGQLFSHPAWLILCSILDSRAIPPDKLAAIWQSFTQLIPANTTLAELAFDRGVEAAYRVINNLGEDGKKLAQYLAQFFYALDYLAKIRYYHYPLLQLLLPPITEKVGEIPVAQAKKSSDSVDTRKFLPQSFIPQNLPPIVRSCKDGRLMQLVPAGLCPVDSEDWGGLENIWLPQYYLDIHPVTNADYAKFVAETQHRPPASWQDSELITIQKNLPVTGIPYQDAEAYCKWAGKSLPHACEFKKAALQGKGADLDAAWGIAMSQAEIEAQIQNFYDLKNVKPESKNPVPHIGDEGRQQSQYAHASWKEGLPATTKVCDLFNMASGENYTNDEFLDLLALALGFSGQEKKQILTKWKQVEQKEKSWLYQQLLKEKNALLALDTTTYPQIQKLIEFRRKEWLFLLATHHGFTPPQNITEKERAEFASTNPFAYAPQFTRFFPAGFDLMKYVHRSLPETAKKMIPTFFQHFCTTYLVTKAEKWSILTSLFFSANLKDEFFLSKMIVEQDDKEQQPHYFARRMSRLQTAWREWADLAQDLVKLCQDHGEFFAGMEILLSPVLTNPFSCPASWDADLAGKIELREIIAEHPLTQFDENLFLTLLTNSLSLTQDEKDSILDHLVDLDQSQINALTAIFTEEVEKWRSLSEKHWPELWSLYKKTRQGMLQIIKMRVQKKKTAADKKHLYDISQLKQILSQKLGVPTTNGENLDQVKEIPKQPGRPNDHNKANIDFAILYSLPPELQEHPYSLQPPCDAFLPSHLDIRQMIPEHPDTYFAEKPFLNLIFSSVSLTQGEKKRIIVAIPQLSQYQIDELIKIFLEERHRFMNLDREHWSQLAKLFKNTWDLWPSLVLDCLSQVLSPVDPISQSFSYLEGNFQHWTGSQHYQTKKFTIVQGADEFLLDKKRIADYTKPYLGFRCCIPIVAQEDVSKWAVVVPVEDVPNGGNGPSQPQST